MSAGFVLLGAQLLRILSLSPLVMSIGSGAAVTVIGFAPSAWKIGSEFAVRLAFSCSSSRTRFCISLETDDGVLLLGKS